MTKEICLPDIGGDEVEVTEVLVAVGDQVKAEQPLLTVEGDKVSMEIPAPQSGVISAIKVKIGDKVATGSLIFTFADGNGVAEGAASSATAPPVSSSAHGVKESEKASPMQEIYLPDIGNDPVVVTELLVKVGDSVVQDQSLLTVEGDKASLEIPAPHGGIVAVIKVKQGDQVSTGSLIMSFAAPNTPHSDAATKATDHSSPTSQPSYQPATVDRHREQEQPHHVAAPIPNGATDVHASPAVRCMAREFGIDLAKVQATGPKGRILKEDLHSYVKGVLAISPTTANTVQFGLDLLPWPKVDFKQFGAIEELPLSRVQRVSGANLHRNWVMIPHVTQTERADITELENFRKEQNIAAEKQKLEVKFTPLVFIMKAVAKALEQWPHFNSSLSPDGQKLLLKRYINLGVAVDTPNGLLVPVVRDVNQKGVLELSRELATLSKKARDGKLTQTEMQGGSFTISSLGGIGGSAFTPIINAPEVAILGVSRAEITPQWNGKEFLPRLMMPLSLSYDHRVIDGADGARFITYLSRLLSDIRILVI